MAKITKRSNTAAGRTKVTSLKIDLCFTSPLNLSPVMTFIAVTP
ncbi:hypothetical protein ES703_81377 [subsurface metagenome]